jgi:hypothetical protein
MRMYDVSFFCELGESPRVHFLKQAHVVDGAYPITIQINASDEIYKTPRITIHIDHESDFINFCNSFLNEFKRFTNEVPND